LGASAVVVQYRMRETRAPTGVDRQGAVVRAREHAMDRTSSTAVLDLNHHHQLLQLQLQLLLLPRLLGRWVVVDDAWFAHRGRNENAGNSRKRTAGHGRRSCEFEICTWGTTWAAPLIRTREPNLFGGIRDFAYYDRRSTDPAMSPVRHPATIVSID
jgi:hypothetical protein